MSPIELALAEAWKRLPPGGRAFCAVSGGLDSLTLLEAAFRFRNARDPGRELGVLHVNHGLRGEESDGDEALVREYSERRGLAFFTHRLEWKGARPTQALCRERREEFFRSLLGPADRLFLAHHLDDQAETVLLRLLRGSGIRGLGGMRAEAGKKIRPFLGISKAEIERQARAWGLEWREDGSNRRTKYERNWLRIEILPRLAERRPGVARRLAALAEEAAAFREPARAFSSFTLNEDWRFYRRPELLASSAAALSEVFGLSRLHTRGLQALLRKGTGRHTAEGLGFRLSGDILLAERRPFSPNGLTHEESGKAVVENPLGRWRVELGRGDRLGFASSLRLGEKAKKEFQRHRVPVFFRDWVPLLVRGGRPAALLPAQEAAFPGAEITPGELGIWWLGSSHSIRSER